MRSSSDFPASCFMAWPSAVAAVAISVIESSLTSRPSRSALLDAAMMSNSVISPSVPSFTLPMSESPDIPAASVNCSNAVRTFSTSDARSPNSRTDSAARSRLMALTAFWMPPNESSPCFFPAVAPNLLLQVASSFFVKPHP